MERSDQEWVRALKRDDPQAVQDLWEMLYRFAWAAARRYQQTEDVSHDAAIAAYQRIRKRGVYQYRFNCPFPGYCRVILFNELRRKLNRLPPTDSPLPKGLGRPDRPPAAARDIVQDRLRPCLERLDNRKREVIELRYLSQLSPTAVAERLGLSRNNVNTLAHRARQLLRECLESYGFKTAGDVLGL